MLRLSCRRLLPFDAILCGTLDQLSSHGAGNAELIKKATSEYRRRTAEAALPLPLAVTTAASYVQNKSSHNALLTLFSTHPERECLIQSVSNVLSDHQENTKAMSPVDWISFLDLLKKVDASVDSIVFSIQCAAASYAKAQHGGAPIGGDVDRDECEREALRSWTVRFIRYHPASAPSLLRPLCLLSRCKDSDLLPLAKDDVLEVVQHALKEGFVNPSDCGLVLQLVHQPGRVLSLWRWMQHTSAKWDQVAASEAVIALCRHRRFPEAVNVLQTLASVNVCPTIPAQVAFLDLLAHLTPTLPDYGDQLVEYWHPEESKRWTEDVVDVVAAQLFLHFRCGNYDRCLSLMMSAVDHLLKSESEGNGLDLKRQEAFVRFMSGRGLFQVVRYFFMDVAENDKLRGLFFDQSAEIIEMFASRSTAISIMIGIGRRMEAEAGIPKIYEAMKKLAPIIDDIAFEKVMRAIAEDYSLNSSHETLELMQNISSLLNKPIPSEIVGWLQLV